MTSTPDRPRLTARIARFNPSGDLIDDAILLVIARVGWTALSNIAIVLLIASLFTPELQGYYYTFSSLLALQVFVELGLNQVIVQFASHEWSHLGLDAHGRVTGSADALSRLTSLARHAWAWYGKASVTGTVLVSLLGIFFFSGSPDGVQWGAPWVAFCVLSGIRVWLQPLWSLLEGCNQVAKVNGFRLGQAVSTTLAISVAVVAGAGLWTPAVAVATELAWSAIFVSLWCRNFYSVFLSRPTGPQLDWKREVRPVHVRISLSWLSGYFISSLFTPASFKFGGAAAGGRMGMALSIVSAVSALASAWRSTKAPLYGMLIARGEFDELDRLHARVTGAALVASTSVAAAVWAVGLYLHDFGYSIADRILPPLPMGLFLLAIVVQQVPNAQATYLRAYKREPLVGVSMAQAALVALSVWFLGRPFGAVGMGIGYLGIVSLVVAPWVASIWYRCRSEWRSPAVAGSPSTVAVGSIPGGATE